MQHSLACYQRIGQICVICQLLAVVQLHCICGWGLYCPCFLSVPSTQSSTSLSICPCSCIACLCSYKDNEVIVLWAKHNFSGVSLAHETLSLPHKACTIAECIKAQLQHMHKQTIVAYAWEHLPICWHVELISLGVVYHYVIAAVCAITALLAW